MMNKKIEELLAELTTAEKSALTAGSDMWHSSSLERLGIPALRMSDGPNGVRGLAKDTDPETSASFPVGIALAATWNPGLIRQIGQALGQEALSKGVHVLLGPTVNIHRAPNAGRNFECFSEDPYLSSRAAIAYIQGVQSEGVAACVKHFVCNDQETERFTISAEVSERALQEIYLPPFKAAVFEARVQTVMSAYNRLNGVYASENHQLLVERLKNKWGFDGLVISDWYGTYSHDAAINGCDLEMPGPARWMGGLSFDNDHLPDQEILNDQVRRLLRTLFRTNAFLETTKEQRATFEHDHQKLIKRTGTEAIVLLKNERDILPLKADRTRKIALIGQLAKEASFQGGGSSQVTPHYLSSPLDALNKTFEGEIHYAQGYNIRKQPPALDHAWLLNKDPETGPLIATYYDNIKLSGEPVHQVTCQTTSLSWFGETAEHWDPKQFSLCLDGYIQPPTSQEYTFTLSLVGRGRVFLNDDLILDLSGDPSAEKSTEVDIVLSAEREYALRIEYNSDLDLRWRNVHLGVAPSKNPDLLQEAIMLAEETDLALVFAGLSPEWESEGIDRESLDLPGNQDLLIREVARVNQNTIVILQTGSPVAMPWLDDVPAVIQSWYLGQESGNAVAEVIAGSVDPGGRLPITFPADIKDSPAYGNFPGENGKVDYKEGIFVGYRHYDKAGVNPLFPFGHGLSYTSFDYDNLRLNGEKFQAGAKIEIRFEITNKGYRPGWDVAQLYLSDLEPAFEKPTKELKAFQKVYLAPGETVKVCFHLQESDLAYYDDSRQAWHVDSGKYTVLIGRSSNNILLSKSFYWE